jgi:hypothetical protein
MGIPWLGGLFGLDTNEMAKSSKARADERRVAVYVARLAAAKVERSVFEIAMEDMEADGALTSADVIAIAHRYNKGGKKPTSRAAALAMMRKRFVEIVRTANKNKVAEKARPW